MEIYYLIKLKKEQLKSHKINREGNVYDNKLVKIKGQKFSHNHGKHYEFVYYLLIKIC